MSDYEYTPPTEDVRDAYALSRVNLFAQGYTEQGDRDRSARADFDRWLADTLAKHDAEVAAIIVDRIRKHCTPSVEAYAAGGDAVILAVADWIENPPDWVDAPWAGRGE